jgi:hypothetical protein
MDNVPIRADMLAAIANGEPLPRAKWQPNLAAAFAAAQVEMPDITKGRRAKVEMKGGGSYSYTYADLSDVLEAVRPILGKHGLFVTQDCIRRANMIDTYTTLGHLSGESVDFGPMSFEAGGTPQTAGSAVTYARRYALLAALGLATEDDDGQAAAQAPKAAPRKQAPPPDETSAEPAKPGNTPAMKRMMAMMNERGLVERASRLAFTTEAVGREVTTASDLTPAEIATVCTALEAVEVPT